MFYLDYSICSKKLNVVTKDNRKDSIFSAQFKDLLKFRNILVQYVVLLTLKGTTKIEVVPSE